MLRAHLVNCVAAEDRARRCPGASDRAGSAWIAKAHKFRERSHLQQVTSVLASILTSSLGYILVRSHSGH